MLLRETDFLPQLWFPSQEVEPPTHPRNAHQLLGAQVTQDP